MVVINKDQINQVVALRLFFVTQSLGLSLWLLRIPEVKSTIGLTLIDLSMALFMQPLGVLVGFFIAPNLIKLIGNKKSCLYFGALFISSFILIPIAETFTFLSIILFISGMICAVVEVSMNAIAAQMEEQFKMRMMSRFHAFWSIGALISGCIVTLLSSLKISFLLQQILIIPLILLMAIVAANSLPNYNYSNEYLKQKTLNFFKPPLSLIILCITPFGALLLEGALMEWTAVLKRDYQNLTDLKVGIIFCTFTLSMTLFRFYGDQIINNFGINWTISVSITSSFFGMILFAQSNTLLFSIIGATLVGAGIANIYPLTMTLTAALPGIKEKNVSMVAFVSFCAFLMGAPLIGFLGEYFGLHVALSLIAPTSLLPLLYLLNGNKKS